MKPRRDVVMVLGGLYHDLDFVRFQLLQAAARLPHLRVRLAETYDMTVISGASALITYTCGVLPDADTTEALARWVENGGRWLALHGTNSLLDIAADGQVSTPPLSEALFDLLGSQFMAHPVPSRHRIRKKADHPLTTGIDSFFVEDEHYLQRHAAGNIVLFASEFAGETNLFATRHWDKAEHQTVYLRPRGAGGVLYITLGHARGPYDMRPVTDSYPFIERGAWGHPEFDMLIARGLGWLDRDPRLE